jgi:23S rRNA pseudouridine955/2504/2580 synthase
MSCHLNSQSNKKNSVRHVEVIKERDAQRLDNFLITQLKGVPKSAVYRLIRTGQVRVNGKRCKPHSKLFEGDKVRIPPVHTREEGSVIISDAVIQQITEATLYADDNYIVVNKPSGMAVHSGSNLPWGLIDVVQQSHKKEYIELAHRIDRETSGCVILARSGQALKHVSEQFRNGSLSKRYLCLMEGQLKPGKSIVDVPLLKLSTEAGNKMEVNSSGKSALTHFQLLESFADASYVEAELFTGRTHQIRVHAAHLNHPLACDDRYGNRKTRKVWKKRGLKRLFLHAHQLEFESISGSKISVEAPLPETLRKVLDTLSN